MKNLNVLVLLGVLLLVPISILAHGPGGHKATLAINAEEAKSIAGDAVKVKIKEGKLESSWSSIEPNEPTKEIINHHGSEWIITFDNTGVQDKKKQKLYVFLNMQGHVTGINFTGK